MKRRILVKFLGAYIFLILIAVFVLNFFVGAKLMEYYEKETSNKLISNALLAGEYLQVDMAAGRTADIEEKTGRLAALIGLRVTVVGVDGVVLGDSETDPKSMENHLNREEILEAVSSGTGQSSRLSGTLDLNMKYVAVRVEDEGRLLGIVRLAVPLTEIKHEKRIISGFLALGGVLAIIVTLIIGYFVSRNISLPISKMEETARSIAGGDLSKRADVGSNDELGALALSLNQMADELQAKLENLEKMDKIRTDFVANVSHELKTPLTSIKGFIETLEDGAIDDKENARRFLSIIRKHAERLSNIINDLLKIAELERADMTFRHGKCDLKSLVDEVVWGFGHAVSAKEQRLNVDYRGEDLQIKGDRDKLEQVLTNLIDNAIKYTGKKGEIRVALFGESESVMVTVEDNGIGIPQEHLDRIFERFYTVDKARSRDMGGTGLGLSIVKHIVMQHGGHIDIESEAGKGTKVTLILPR